MIIKFDKFNRARKPNITLCNPNEDELFSLSDSAISNRQLTLRFNAISEFSFTAQEKYPDGTVCPFYDYLRTTRLIKIQDIGTFIITRVIDVDTGIFKSKDVECKSVEYEISQRAFSIDEGTYKFYDPINNENTIMGLVMNQLPDWSIGSIDSDLWNLYRTFDFTEVNLYDFMVSNMEEAYECIFIFDSIKRTITAKTVKNAVKETEIFLSHKNLVKETTITESSDELKTALSIYGADDLSIHSVNPLGGSTIYDFSYYKTTEWMSQDLIDAINAWEKKLETATVTNNKDLSKLKALKSELLVLNTQLKELKGELKSLENIKAVRLEQGLDIADVNRDIAAKEAQISAKQIEINNVENSIKSIQSDISQTTSNVSFENNFTEDQYKTLMRFIKVGTYQNDSFAVTDSMTDIDKQNTAESLMETGKEVLSRVSQPALSFEMEAVNFLNLIGYARFITELQLGSEITYETRDKNRFAYPVLLEMSINYDDATDITLSFGNRLRLDKSEYTFADLFKDTVNTVGEVNFNKGKWGEGVKAKNEFNEFLNNSLNASLQEIINSDYQDILIDSSGIRCRRFNPSSGEFDPEQLWITGKAMVFTDDGFKTAKTALGNILLPDGTRAYGINAEVLLGKLIAGSQIQIMNGDKSFVIDENGVYIKNANIVITNEDEEEVTLDDIYNNGILAQDRINGVTDEDGQLIAGALAGDILAGKNNIVCINPITENVVRINENGIILANSKDSTGEWEWKTAISAMGIEAEAIRSNGTLYGMNIMGGTLDIGDKSFTVDSDGNVKITKGSIDLGDGSFVVDSNGDIKITKGSIDIGDGAFSVDSLGNVIATSMTLTGAQVNDSDLVGGSINIGNGKFTVDKNGNCNMSGSLTLGGDINITGAIKWSSSSSPVKVLYSEDGETYWHEVYSSNDKFAKYSYDGGETWTDPVKISADGDDIDIKLPEFIKETYIDGSMVESPILRGGLIEGATLRSIGTKGSAIEVCNEVGTLAGYIKYDEEGNGTTEGTNRMYICTDNGYNMKLKSSKNMSLSAETIYIEGRLIVNGEEYPIAVFG